MANGATFNWGLASLVPKKLFFLDAHLSPTLVKAGDFDLAGMLAMLAAKKKEMGAQWIVFDGLDVLVTLLQDPVAEMQEIASFVGVNRPGEGFHEAAARLYEVIAADFAGPGKETATLDGFCDRAKAK